MTQLLIFGLFAFMLSVPGHNTPQVDRLTPPPVPSIQTTLPSSLTLYKPTGEKVAYCVCSFSKDVPTLKSCEIEKGATLDDVMNAWLDAYKNKRELEQ